MGGKEESRFESPRFELEAISFSAASCSLISLSFSPEKVLVVRKKEDRV